MLGAGAPVSAPITNGKHGATAEYLAEMRRIEAEAGEPAGDGWLEHKADAERDDQLAQFRAWLRAKWERR